MKKLCVISAFLIMIANQAFGLDFLECNDQKLHELIKSNIEKQNITQVNLSPVNLRFIRLLAKYTDSFEEVKVDDFAPKDDYLIADRMLDLKINHKYEDSSFRICKNNYSVNGKSMYLMMYEEDGKIMVEVSNAIATDFYETLKFEY